MKKTTKTLLWGGGLVGLLGIGYVFWQDRIRKCFSCQAAVDHGVISSIPTPACSACRDKLRAEAIEAYQKAVAADPGYITSFPGHYERIVGEPFNFTLPGT